MEGGPPLAMPEGSLAYYKSQYEQLEHELAEFQASSHQLEAELEKDVEAAEERERILKDKVESLRFEVEEWKAKYKQSKIEASTAQGTLQKEITSLRDANRTLQLKIRDIEVENDDIERQARNTSSSLEDLESKYNVAIERAVIIEEEIRIGEQERENLRVENQRLRDELSDLKIEAEIMQNKLRKRQLSPVTTTTHTDHSFSPSSSVSSPLVPTPPETKSAINSTVSGNETPPSPPISETSGPVKPSVKTPTSISKPTLNSPSGGSSITPKPTSRYSSLGLRSSRGSAPKGSNLGVRTTTPSIIRQTRAKAPITRGLPNSNSLTHIRSLTAQMQRLEQRVQSARSKLPTPVMTPPRSSPRDESVTTKIPSSVTIRSRKRIAGSNMSTSSAVSEDLHVSSGKQNSTPTSEVNRLSFGNSQIKKGDLRSISRRSDNFTRLDWPSSRSGTHRSQSRSSISGARSSLGLYSQSQYSESQKFRLSLGNSYSSSPHSHVQPQGISQNNLEESRALNLETPTRRRTYGKNEEKSSIPVRNEALRRKSGTSVPLSRRTESGDNTDCGSKTPNRSRKLSDLGETY